MMQEIYQLTLTHYMQDEEGNRIRLEEPVVCNSIFDRRFGNPVIVLNEIFERTKEYVLRKAAEGGAE